MHRKNGREAALDCSRQPWADIQKMVAVRKTLLNSVEKQNCLLRSFNVAVDYSPLSAAAFARNTWASRKGAGNACVLDAQAGYVINQPLSVDASLRKKNRPIYCWGHCLKLNMHAKRQASLNCKHNQNHGC